MATERKVPNLDTVTTINEDGSKFNIHPADVKGRFTWRRRLTAWMLVVIYVIIPWIKIDGFPAVFLDINQRQFHLFGIHLFSQNLWIFFFFISGLAYLLFVLSSIVGRVWCGWFCPFTVFLEHIYRRAERLIEGDALKRKKLDDLPWNAHKIIKRGTTWLGYVLISLFVALVFLSYFLSVDHLLEHISAGPSVHSGEWIFILVFTLIFTFMFGWFREQFCIILCPYGRFQSALTDDDTITVFYDPLRGEPRGKKRKQEDATSPLGDCIDCRRCVTVCPTGIDIRDGIQLECIACSACIDACDDIMTKVKRPTGLIRYDSLNGIETGKRKIFRPRIFIYVFFTLIGSLIFLKMLPKAINPVHADITRLRGDTFTATDDGVRNTFHIIITNKLNREVDFSFALQGNSGIELDTGMEKLSLEGLKKQKIAITLHAPREAYKGPEAVRIKVINSEGDEIELSTKFMGPNPVLYRRKYEKQP